MPLSSDQDPRRLSETIAPTQRFYDDMTTRENTPNSEIQQASSSRVDSSFPLLATQEGSTHATLVEHSTRTCDIPPYEGSSMTVPRYFSRYKQLDLTWAVESLTLDSDEGGGDQEAIPEGNEARSHTKEYRIRSSGADDGIDTSESGNSSSTSHRSRSTSPDPEGSDNNVGQFTRQTGNAASPSSNSNHGRVNSSSDSSTVDKGKKRALCNEGDDDGHGTKQPKKRGSGPPPNDTVASGSAGKTTILMACPFYKKHPLFYCQKRKFGDYTQCARKGFKKIKNVKEHLREVHVALYCSQCYLRFSSSDEQSNHSECLPCVHQSADSLEGLNETKLEKLVKRFRSKDKAVNWRKVWTTIWPHAQDTIPSPDFTPPPTPLYPAEDIMVAVDETFTLASDRDALLTRLHHILLPQGSRSSLTVDTTMQSFNRYRTIRPGQPNATGPDENASVFEGHNIASTSQDMQRSWNSSSAFSGYMFAEAQPAPQYPELNFPGHDIFGESYGGGMQRTLSTEEHNDAEQRRP